MVSKEELRETVRDLFDLMYPGWTDEDLLYRPRDLRHFTRVVGAKIGQNPNSYTVSAALSNARKDGGNAFGKRRKSSPEILKLEIQASQVEITVDEFKKVVVDVFLRDNHPSKAEDLLHRCDAAEEFCQNVRDFLGHVDNVQIPDTMILRALNNLRKDGRFRPGSQNGL
jgi:hypothetical protein